MLATKLLALAHFSSSTSTYRIVMHSTLCVLSALQIAWKHNVQQHPIAIYCSEWTSVPKLVWMLSSSSSSSCYSSCTVCDEFHPVVIWYKTTGHNPVLDVQVFTATQSSSWGKQGQLHEPHCLHCFVCHHVQRAGPAPQVPSSSPAPSGGVDVTSSSCLCDPQPSGQPIKLARLLGSLGPLIHPMLA